MLGTPRGTPVPPDTPPHGIPRLAHRPIRIASRPPLDVTDRAKFLWPERRVRPTGSKESAAQVVLYLSRITRIQLGK